MQSSKNSLMESLASVLAGYGVAVFGQLVIFPLVGISTSLSNNFIIAFLFSILSLIRSFVLRRIFNYFTG